MFGHMHGALNVKKKLIAQFACKLRDEFSEPNCAMIDNVMLQSIFANDGLIKFNKFVSQFICFVISLRLIFQMCVHIL